MQERRNSIDNALELCLSCTKPPIWSGVGVTGEVLMLRGDKNGKKSNSGA